MAVRVVERSQGFLEPGERVRQVVLAQGGINPWFQGVFVIVAFIGVRIAGEAAGVGAGGVLLGALAGMTGALIAAAFISRRVILVTDRAMVVLEYGSFGGVKPTRVRARLPLDTPIARMTGIWGRTELAGERLWVHKRWRGEAAQVA